MASTAGIMVIFSKPKLIFTKNILIKIQCFLLEGLITTSLYTVSYTCIEKKKRASLFDVLYTILKNKKVNKACKEILLRPIFMLLFRCRSWIISKYLPQNTVIQLIIEPLFNFDVYRKMVIPLVKL